MFTIWITLDGVNIRGSPFDLAVITLRPESTRCIVRGEALHKAIARIPMKFEVLFVDVSGSGARRPRTGVHWEGCREDKRVSVQGR